VIVQPAPVVVGSPAPMMPARRWCPHNVRHDAVMALGHSRVERAVAPLAAPLAGDRRPVVPDAAARALTAQ
jgi:hypothetical protein